MAEEITGRFTLGDINYIKANLDKPSSEIAQVLNRKQKAVENKITQLGLKKTTKGKRRIRTIRSDYLSSLDERDRKEAFSREVRASARYRLLSKSFAPEDMEVYVEKYVDYMMDPTIETMTSPEKDGLHQKFINEIRINNYLKEEKDSREEHKKDSSKPIINRSREIKECQEVISKLDKSLNIEREQRLKNQSDQAITFTNLIRDFKNPDIRKQAGLEMAMFKYLEGKYYNEALGKNIISGRDTKINIDILFKSGKAPDLPADFTPEKKENGEMNGTEPSGQYPAGDLKRY